MNKKMLGIGILFVLLIAGTAMAFGGNFMANADSETRQQIQTAIQNNDFKAWKEMHESFLTEENFNSLREMHQERFQMREQMQENMEAVHTAIENNDFQTWKILMEENSFHGQGMLSAITEENFSLLSEMHSAMQSGDFDTADSIREELGLNFMGKRMHKGFGMRNFSELQ